MMCVAVMDFRALAFLARGGLCYTQEDLLACARACRLRACRCAAACSRAAWRRGGVGNRQALLRGRWAGQTLRHLAAKCFGIAASRGDALRARVQPAHGSFQVERLPAGQPKLVCRCEECARERDFSDTRVKWPSRAAWRYLSATKTSRWPPPWWRGGGARRAYRIGVGPRGKEYTV